MGLYCDITKQEVKDALWSIKEESCLGLMAIIAHFLRKLGELLVQTLYKRLGIFF